jgi:phage/plasmid-associated DNA primase
LIRIRELFKAYSGWCDENNKHGVSERFFGLHLKEMGFEQSRTSEYGMFLSIFLY